MTWILILISILATSLTFMVIHTTYTHSNNGLLSRWDIQFYQFLMQSTFYLIEPNEIKWFSSKLSAGQCLKMSLNHLLLKVKLNLDYCNETMILIAL